MSPKFVGADSLVGLVFSSCPSTPSTLPYLLFFFSFFFSFLLKPYVAYS